MKFSHFLIIIFLLNLFFPIELDAQNTVKTQDLSDACVKNWKMVTSIYYKLHRNSKQYDNYYVDMEWWMTPDFYRFSKRQVCKDSFNNQNFDESYDGTHHALSYYNERTMRISSRDATSHLGLWNEKSIETPYEFLYSPEANKQGIIENFKTIQDTVGVSNTFAKGSAPTMTQFDSHACVTMDFPGGKDEDGYPYNYNYRVYFDLKNNNFPICWEKIAIDINPGYAYADYKVTEIGIAVLNNQNFMYPKHAEGNFYKILPTKDEITNRPPPGITVEYGISDVSFDKLEASDFMLDPASFKFIEDLDSGKIMLVPQ